LEHPDRVVSSACARPAKGQEAAASTCNKSVSQLGSSTHQQASTDEIALSGIADPARARWMDYFEMPDSAKPHWQHASTFGDVHDSSLSSAASAGCLPMTFAIFEDVVIKAERWSRCCRVCRAPRDSNYNSAVMVTQRHARAFGSLQHFEPRLWGRSWM
jgi:hypothetical protein